MSSKSINQFNQFIQQQTTPENYQNSKTMFTNAVTQLNRAAAAEGKMIEDFSFDQIKSVKQISFRNSTEELLNDIEFDSTIRKN